MKRYRRWLGLAAAANLVAATGLVTWQAWPLLVLYWDVGRLLSSVTFSLQVAAILVNLMLFTGVVVLATAISRTSLVRASRRPRRSSFLLSVLVIGLLVYLYPLLRTSVLAAGLAG
jgi:hypothetical protein